MSISHDVSELYDLNEEIWQTQHEMLSLLGEVGESRSQETGNHVRRVAKYSKLLGELYGLEEEEIHLVYSASPMHDIGKIGIPDSILLKPGKLDPEEYEVMKTHSSIGYDILKNSSRPLLQAAAIIANEHHEKWDGSGYPNALSGENIHIYGRIIALADVFDALSCDRVYKKAWPMDKIIELIINERGRHFDPNLVDMFMANLERFTDIASEFKD
jgi:response regulator RpfG family c-di-GMP phosphodiesterase